MRCDELFHLQFEKETRVHTTHAFMVMTVQMLTSRRKENVSLFQSETRHIHREHSLAKATIGTHNTTHTGRARIQHSKAHTANINAPPPHIPTHLWYERCDLLVAPAD